jgi:phosphoribosylaminoimidazole-succinocarboxamide synthase
LPAGLKNASKLPEPIYTPAAKAAVGDHDENITFEQTVEMIGLDLATRIRDISMPSTRRRLNCLDQRHHHCRHQV